MKFHNLLNPFQILLKIFAIKRNINNIDGIA